MNAETITVEVRFLGVNQTRDCSVSRDLTVRELGVRLIELLGETTGIEFGDYPDVMLLSQRRKTALNPDMTLDELGIDSGDTLFLI